MSSMNAMVVSLTAVTHLYGKTRALDAVAVEIPSGRMVGLLGPDGVGKSTLLDLIAGARKIQAGTVRVLGGNMADARHRKATCPRIAYMPQGLGKNLYAELSVFENLDFFGQLFAQSAAERRARITGLLKATGSPDELKARTAAESLGDGFVALLPAEKRGAVRAGSRSRPAHKARKHRSSWPRA